ncbi:MAG: hypothetical protein ACLTZM_21275 [Ruminococcus sp.]
MVTTASTAEKLAAIRLKKCGGNLKKAFTWSSTKIKYFGGVKKPEKVRMQLNIMQRMALNMAKVTAM